MLYIGAFILFPPMLRLNTETSQKQLENKGLNSIINIIHMLSGIRIRLESVDRIIRNTIQKIMG